MKVLVTSARMPFALAVMRRLRQAGHEVFSSDTYDAAPGNHSRYVSGHAVTASPRAETERFIEQVAEFCAEHGVDVIVPTWEEAFYLATGRERLEQVAALYTPQFETLARVHDKHSFEALVEQLGIPRAGRRHRAQRRRAARGGRALAALLRPRRVLARRRDAAHQHRAAGRPGPRRGRASHARRALARAGVRGRADGLHLQHAARRPRDRALHLPRRRASTTTAPPCSSSRSTASESLAVVRAPRRGARLHRPDVARLRGLRRRACVIIECNPRTTDGALLMESDELAGSLLDPDHELVMVPPGRVTQLDLAVIGAMFSDGLREVPGIDPRPAPHPGRRPRLARPAARASTRSWPSATTSG